MTNNGRKSKHRKKHEYDKTGWIMVKTNGEKSKKELGKISSNERQAGLVVW